MAANVLGTIEITDRAGMTEYREKIGPVLERDGGRYLAGRPPVVKEGDARPHVAAVLEFPSMDQLNGFSDADESQDLTALRQRSTRGSVLFLDGVPGQ